MDISNELKTPLSIANLEIEKLQKRMNISNSEIQSISNEILSISETINSFLGWAELENSKKKISLFMNRLSEVVHNFISRVTLLEKEIKIVVYEDFYVPANSHHLEQLIHNLISNAINHSGPQAKVIIELNRGMLTVIDNGPGIPEDVLSRLGEPFNKTMARPNSHVGHGLGLAWIFSITKFYGWEIQVMNLKPGVKIQINFNLENEKA